MKAIVAGPSLAILCGLGAVLVAGGAGAQQATGPANAKPGE